MNGGGVPPNTAEKHRAYRKHNGNKSVTGNDVPEIVHECLAMAGLSIKSLIRRPKLVDELAELIAVLFSKPLRPKQGCHEWCNRTVAEPIGERPHAVLEEIFPSDQCAE